VVRSKIILGIRPAGPAVKPKGKIKVGKWWNIGEKKASGDQGTEEWRDRWFVGVSEDKKRSAS